MEYNQANRCRRMDRGENMAEELYFQWQNDALRTTIYPRREVMLSNFLVFYREIDLWAEYQNKDISGKVRDYHARKKQAVEKAVKAYYDYRNYFMKEDVRADYLKKFGKVDEEAMEKIHAFHKTFGTYMPRFTNPRSETYFVSQQMLYWQQALKDYKNRVVSKQRRVFVMKSQVPPHPNVPKEEAELAAMEKTALPMRDEEYRRLSEFVTASSKIEKRKLELAKAVQDTARKSEEATRKLNGLKLEIERQAPLQKKSSEDLGRLKSPPDLASVEAYFSATDVAAQVRAKYPKASEEYSRRLSEYRKSLRDQLSYSRSASSKRIVVRNVLWNVGQYQKSIQKEILKHDTDLRNMGPTWKHRAERAALRDNLRDVSQAAVAEEMERLAGFQSALENADRSKEETARLIAAEEKELAGINTKLSQLRKDAQALQAELDLYDDILIVTEEKRLAEYVPDPSRPVAVKEIVQLELDEYKASLAQKDHYELLEMVVQRFRSQPDRYPKWLQYMVIHFSGMRYASAHGSWADPKDLLANLRILSIDKELKAMDEDAVEAFCREKLESYEPNGSVPAGTIGARPKLSRTTDSEWKERVEGHVKRIRRAIEINSPSHQRSALVNLRTDESNFEIDSLEPAEVYEQLMSYKDDLPDWMWKEIVKLTDLRVNEVTDKNWEKSGTDPQQYSRKDAELRKVLNDWKNKFVTGWREEHDRSDKLIVTRAVCNEVAEHIQHLRGHSPDGGLTAKPKWFQRLENANPREAYLVKPDDRSDFKQGASILWLRFVRKEPNAWQVAQHITTKKGGHGLLPASFTGKTGWSYNRGGPITRTRTVTGEKGAAVRQLEWLRWIHEATVVEVADTAEGTIVLTFETALPSDDPRLSSIGVFKHRLSDLLSDGDEDYYNRAFIGYTPEGDLPMENLKDMLDWSKILHRPKSMPQ
jgi:hypothetical protein